MRGKEDFQSQTLLNLRITPAYAGKSFSNCQKYSDHIGSPPPMRGKVDCAIACNTDIRITPAYAGKSPALSAMLTDA